MYQRIGLLLVFLMASSVTAQTINLRGKISDKTGKAIQNAQVTLIRQGLTDTTGTDGMYSIVKNNVAVVAGFVPKMEQIVLVNNSMEFSLNTTSSITVEIFGVTGQLLKRECVPNATAGVYQVDITEYLRASKLLIIRASTDRSSMTFRYLPLRNGNYTLQPSTGNQLSADGCLTLATTNIDSLRVTASTFQTKTISVSSYDQELNISLDSAGTTLPSNGCGKVNSMKTGTYYVTVNGKRREYIIDVPANYSSSTPYRLIFGFHWMGGTAVNVATGNTVPPAGCWKYYGLKRIADSTKTYCIFVAPQGLGGAGATGWPNSGGEDVAFVDSMISIVESDLCIDKSRIFSVGFSYGGMMGNTLACERADVFRAIASHNGAGGCSKTQKPIAFLGIAGTIERESVRTTAIRIAKANGCRDTMPQFPASGTRSHLCTVFQGCNTKYPVKFCAFDQGHKAAIFDGSNDVDDCSKSWIPGEDWSFFMQF
jgi:hypothetical protein